MSSRTIYILRLLNNKIYVGSTTDLERRLAEHRAGQGSVWTAMYPMLEVVRTIPDASAADEDGWVKTLMYQFGVNNVRGGSYTNPVLDASQRAAIQHDFVSCGRTGHWLRTCAELRAPICAPPHFTQEDIEAQNRCVDGADFAEDRSGRPKETEAIEAHLVGSAAPITLAQTLARTLARCLSCIWHTPVAVPVVPTPELTPRPISPLVLE